MGSIQKRHEDFIRELQSPFKSNEDKERAKCPSDNGSRLSESDIELQRELERKFDKLFGGLSDDTDDYPP